VGSRRGPLAVRERIVAARHRNTARDFAASFIALCGLSLPSFWLGVLDIDHFKRVNDTHGHAAGDQVIRAVASALMDSVRPMDLVARVGAVAPARIDAPAPGYPAFGRGSERPGAALQRRAGCIPGDRPDAVLAQ
jgi:hypothetical protein